MNQLLSVSLDSAGDLVRREGPGLLVFCELLLGRDFMTLHSVKANADTGERLC